MAGTVAGDLAGRDLHFAGAAGVRIAATEWGGQTDDVVILLHGGGQTRRAWDQTGARLARAGFRVLALDMRGHGESAWAQNGDYSRDALVADLLACQATCVPMNWRVALVGASTGGITALTAVGEGSLEAWALVLVDVVPEIDREGADRVLSFMTAAPEGFGSVDEAADAIAAYLPHRKRPADTSGLSKNLRQDADGRFRWHWDPKFIPGAIENGYVNADRASDAARQLNLPTLLVRGQLSDIVSERGAKEFLELVPHAEYVDVTGAGHMVAGDRNDAFGDDVVAFLSRHRPSNGEQL